MPDMETKCSGQITDQIEEERAQGVFWFICFLKAAKNEKTY